MFAITTTVRAWRERDAATAREVKTISRRDFRSVDRSRARSLNTNASCFIAHGETRLPDTLP